MEAIKSGKELCDDFFGKLKTREDIDTETASLLIKLYSEGELTVPKIRDGLKASREANHNAQ